MIAIEQCFDHRRVPTRLVGRKRTVRDRLQRSTQRFVSIAKIGRTVAVRAQLRGLGRRHTEYENIFRADTVFDLDLTRNRPDCWGHMGVARDLSARMRLAFGNDVPGTPSHPVHALPLTIADEESCGRFTATVVKNIRVAQSPQWLQDRLARSGMRPINNIVDATNYVTYQTLFRAGRIIRYE